MYVVVVVVVEIYYFIFLINKILLTLLINFPFLASNSKTLTSEGKVEFFFVLKQTLKKSKT